LTLIPRWNGLCDNRQVQQRRRLDGDDPVVAGVAAAIARRLDVETLAVRAAFVVLTVAGGWGVALYAACWVGLVWRNPLPPRPEPSAALVPVRRIGLLLGAVGALLILRARVAGFHDQLVWPSAVVAAAGILGWRQFGLDEDSDVPEARPHLVRVAAGLFLVLGGFAYLGAADLPVRVLRDGLVAVGVVAGGFLLVFAPWVVQLTRSLAEERRERIRADERAEVATHLHDSVLQTLTLLQKRADDPQLMAALARHQERELRRWLYSAPDPHDGRGFREAVEAMVAEVEDQHLVHVDNVTVGDGPIEARLQSILSAAREALVNAAKFSGERTVSLYAELRPGHVELFVRDRGAGFLLEEVADDRKGISDSILARIDRLGGTAQVRTAPGAGTEVRMRLELSA
jgi:signal transduction histidine kinase